MASSLVGVVDLLTGHWLLSPLHEVCADVGTVVREPFRYPDLARAMHVADTPVELLQSILRRLSIALYLVFGFTNPPALPSVPCTLLCLFLRGGCAVRVLYVSLGHR